MHTMVEQKLNLNGASGKKIKKKHCVTLLLDKIVIRI